MFRETLGSYGISLRRLEGLTEYGFEQGELPGSWSVSGVYVERGGDNNVLDPTDTSYLRCVLPVALIG